MRIGNGPRLVVPRGVPTRRRWGYYSRDYEQHLAEQWARIRRARHCTSGDSKSSVRYLRMVAPGKHFRLVDGHGKSYGKRHLRGADDFHLDGGTRVRIVEAQAESLSSQLSRMLTAAHKLAIRED